MDKLLFCDIEAAIKTRKIKELGFIYNNQELKTSSIHEASDFLTKLDIDYIVGHNFIDFDLQILKESSLYEKIKTFNIIDTLPLSLLLFNEKTVHSLPKNYKTEDDFKNNPVEDSKITKRLLEKLKERFLSLDSIIQNIFYNLLKEEVYFSSFFRFIEKDINFKEYDKDTLYTEILTFHKKVIINNDFLEELIQDKPIQLAYILAILTPHIEIKSHPPKILFTYPDIVTIQKKLCFQIDNAIKNISNFSKEVFGFENFREFPRLNADIFDNPSISQREMVEASLKDESFITVLPTGGGKTFTFWLPAIYKSKAYKGLTVVISPLQALIEDHIKSFNSKVANYKAVAISGFMSPLERSEAVEQVINGDADILYIAPESLRSNTIFNILKNRLIERFVIDEAHCLSTWGNDFRQDYYYICEYIKELIEKKDFQEHIPISCFTATAKPSVLKDIEEYFFNGLNIKLDKYLAIPERKNLKYKSIPSKSKDKYVELLKLINEHDGSTLIYIPSSTRKCDEVAKQIALDTNKNVKSFHSKLESQEKMQILKDYIEDKINIIVATTAFGMGVDKSNITNVIHYEISESLENYAQEAGRGARDEKLNAFCPILFDEDDLDKHFLSLSRSKLTASEINSIFRVIKNSKKEVLNKTAFELAKEAGWDVEDHSSNYTTKVKTALLELEREGYISRKRNKVNFFADSIASKSMETLHKKLDESNYTEEEKQKLIIVLQSIIGRGKVNAVQVDELAYILGYSKGDISLAINQLKQLEILGDSKDLSLEIEKNCIDKFTNIKKIELKLFEYLEKTLHSQITIRELNEYLYVEEVIQKNQTNLIKSIIKNWRSKSNFLFNRINREQDLWIFKFENIDNVKETIKIRHYISEKILTLFTQELTSGKKVQIQFSLKELHKQFDSKISIKDIDRTLLYLHHLNVLELLSGRFINYSPMNIIKENKFESKRRYTKEEYKIRLESHYQTKIESIHIMGEYAKRLQEDNYKAKQFLTDYFTLPYEEFKKRYKLSKEKVSKPITQKRYNKIFEKMSDEQKQIISDKNTKAMMILAGPGSGKTKVLVHKIASLILTEDIKPEQFMMLTFSKTAKMEFKSRLNSLIGALSFDVEIQTFHSYALKLIARMTKSDNTILDKAIEEATKQIKEGDITLPQISVLVLDEFQDINEKSFEFVQTIYNAQDKDMRIIAVGDDDQCIMSHIGADTSFIKRFEKEFGNTDEGEVSYKKYELLCNFRSKKNIVQYTNDFILNVNNRFKTKSLYSDSSEEGKVSIFSFKSNNLITPLLNKIKNEDDLENIAILAYTNEEVMQIYSLLQENNIEARYIIDREKFSLKNIVELVDFNTVLNSFIIEETFYKEEHFIKALETIENTYTKSKNLKLIYKIVDKFISESDNFYISQWLSYLEEIKIEDFENFKRNVTVSTIHKSKGMEFDKIYLLVKENPRTDNEKRLYYVGMTRAKNELNILRYGKDIPNKKEYIKYNYDENIYFEEEKKFTHIMSLSDINLGFDNQKYDKNKEFFSGLKVTLEKRENFDKYCIVYEGKILSILSKSFNSKIHKKLNEGFEVFDSTIEFIIQWEDKENRISFRHPLCKIVMKKNLIENIPINHLVPGSNPDVGATKPHEINILKSI